MTPSRDFDLAVGFGMFLERFVQLNYLTSIPTSPDTLADRTRILLSNTTYDTASWKRR
jgi:hypothetical protein